MLDQPINFLALSMITLLRERGTILSAVDSAVLVEFSLPFFDRNFRLIPELITSIPHLLLKI